MFCRWFNHQNLYSKFLTVFCPDSRVLSKKLGRWVGYWMLWWRYFPHEKRSCYASAKLQPFQESSKFVILTNGRGWQWILTGCLNSYQSQVWPRTILLTADRTWRWLQTPIPFYNSFWDCPLPCSSLPAPLSSPVNGTAVLIGFASSLRFSIIC